MTFSEYNYESVWRLQQQKLVLLTVVVHFGLKCISVQLSVNRSSLLFPPWSTLYCWLLNTFTHLWIPLSIRSFFIHVCKSQCFLQNECKPFLNGLCWRNHNFNCFGILQRCVRLLKSSEVFAEHSLKMNCIKPTLMSCIPKLCCHLISTISLLMLRGMFCALKI